MAEWIPDPEPTPQAAGPLAPTGSITNAAAPSNPFSSPQGFRGPGLISNSISMLGNAIGRPRSAKEVYDRTVPTTEGMFQGSLTLAAPQQAISNFLRRMTTQGVISAVGAALAGKDPGDVGLHGLLGTGAGVLGEAVTAPVKLGINSMTHRLAQQRVADSTAKAGAKNKFNDAMADSVNTLQQQSHKGEVQATRDRFAEQLRQERGAYKVNKQQTELGHERAVATQQAQHAKALDAFREKAAKTVVDDYKARVPAWKDFPSDTHGFLDILYGKGPQLLSEDFQKAMEASVAKAAGKIIKMSPDDAAVLGLKVEKDPLSGLSGPARDALVRSGKIQDTGGLVTVDAADAVKGLTGKSSTQAYKRVMRALAEADIWDPEVSAAYKAGSALLDFTNKVKGLKGEQINPGKFLEGFGDTATVNKLRHRGEGDIFRGPLQAMRGAPEAPVPIPKPVIPPYIPSPRPSMPQPPATVVAPHATPETMPGGFKVRQNVFAGHPYASGILGGAGAYGMGLGPMGHAAAMMAGYGAGRAMPKEIVTRAPLSPAMHQTMQNAPGIMALLARLGIMGAPTQPEP